MINKGLKNVVKLSNNMFIEMDSLSHAHLEAAFYFACYVKGQHHLADQTIKYIDDPLDRKDMVIRAWSIAYCRLGKKTVKKVTTPKAKKLFSKHPNIQGDFIETGVNRLWLSIEDKEIRNLPSDKVCVVIPREESFAVMNRADLTEFSEFSLKDLNELQKHLVLDSCN